MKKILALIMALAMVFALCACGSTAAPAATEAKEEAAPAEEVVEAAVETEEAAEEPEGGFTEYPIWEDEEVGFLNVSGVYFQPVPMSGGQENFEGKACHFEADVAAMENDLGFGVGDWVPYMTVTYELTGASTGTVVTGTFMPMSADDGPHYGANLDEMPADTYSVKLTFEIDPNTYLIHLDDVTGPGGTLDDYFGDGPLVLELPDVWDYIPQEW